MASYAERRETRQAHLDERKAALEQEGSRRAQAAVKELEHIPPGQPILVGHYSEAGHRAALARSDRNMRAAGVAFEEAKRVGRASTAILATDDDACEMLRTRIEKAKAAHALMKAANVCVRKQDRAGLAALGFDGGRITSLLTPDFAGRVGFPDYSMSGSTANIRRLEQRLQSLEQAKASPAREQVRGGIRIVEDPEAMRLRLVFPGKPEPTVIAALKANGFRWAPSEQAWQRQLNNAARWAADQIVSQVAATAA